MIYGLYLSASGVVANSHRIDVMSNNLANSETVGFKRDLTLFKQRLTAAQERGLGRNWSDPILERIGGGIADEPSLLDDRQGDLEHTGGNLDVGIQGAGYLATVDKSGTALTRDGRLTVDQAGNLILANSKGTKVLDNHQQPIRLRPNAVNTSIGGNGDITQDGRVVARLGVFDVDDRTQLRKKGANLFAMAAGTALHAGTGQLHSEFIETANVDPATELSELMDAQRQLEANANMIRYQDQMLQHLCNDVGKIS